MDQQRGMLMGIMGTRYRLHNSRKAGFTIVELLIVIAVIGILAAIVIVAFGNIQQRANDTSIRSELSQMAKKLEQFRATSPLDRYPTSATELEEAGIRLSAGNYRLTNPDGTLRNNLYYIISSAGSVEGVGKRYAVGTVPKNALTTTICLVDGKIVVAGCGGGDSTRQLLYPLETVSPFTSSSWPSTGHSTATGGWLPWTNAS